MTMQMNTSENIILVDLENTLIFQEKSELDKIGSYHSDDKALFSHRDKKWYQNSALIDTLEKLKNENGYDVFVATSANGFEVQVEIMENWRFISAIFQKAKSSYDGGMLGVFNAEFPDKKIKNCILIGDSENDQCTKDKNKNAEKLASILLNPTETKELNGVKVCHTVAEVNKYLADFTGNQNLLSTEKSEQSKNTDILSKLKFLQNDKIR